MDDAPADVDGGDEPLPGGTLNEGQVERVGDTIRRPGGKGAEAVEALLVHLEEVGFTGAPRFLGLDDDGPQIPTYVSGWGA